MPITKIGLDLNATKNITTPVFNTTDVKSIISDMPRIANESTNNFFGWGIIIALFTVLYTSLSEKIGNHGFGYDEGQSVALASSITSIMGLILTQVGFIHNFAPIGFIIGVFAIMGIIIIYVNNDTP